MNGLKTWVEINKKAVRRNVKTFRKLIGSKTKLFAVVKSNAYGHGLVVFSKLADALGVDGFCVDSVVEGVRLREEGIEKPILVLGPTFKNWLKIAAENDITITISSLDALKELKASKYRPEFHLKIDSGMHRQGFYPEQVRDIVRQVQSPKSQIEQLLTGAYTHFASAKDINYPTFTEEQFSEFQKAMAVLNKAGFKNIMHHAAATGGTLVNKKYHLDTVRIGIGLYGLWPSLELGIQMGELELEPILSWKAVVSEVKNVKAGEYVGYDLTERLTKDSKMAIIPIGYWHGYPRSLSGVGEVVIKGKRCRLLGRVSMDLIAVDATGINVRRGDVATLIGPDIDAYRLARLAGGISYYELLTRLNPLIERVIK